MYEININSLNIPSHTNDLQSYSGQEDQPDINKAYFCKNDNCTRYTSKFINLPNDIGNKKIYIYIIYTCEHSCDYKMNYNKTHDISFKSPGDICNNNNNNNKCSSKELRPSNRNIICLCEKAYKSIVTTSIFPYP
ncbi:hypothetical protein H8356DRAFT_1436536 [Neocallimastix lanati (nom. inval.)]|nr:hypothetical protein H8356DRAFT_1436536 [Neocallimastix sp. JGI-2020a]